jgi:hypothetical protein
MDQTLRVDLIMIIGTMPRRTLRLGNQNQNSASWKKNKVKNTVQATVQVLGLKTKITVQPRAGKINPQSALG